MKFHKSVMATAIGLSLSLISTLPLQASSHREAPAITEMPKVDGTDFYMFRSYEAGREGYITLIANYHPLQDSYGGPNYFDLDPEALYEIHIDNDGNAKEDITFQFRFKTEFRDQQLKIGEQLVSIPIINSNPISVDNTDNLNRIESYSVTMVRGDRRRGYREKLSNVVNGSRTFIKPVDNIGNKSIPDYESYANSLIHDVNIPGCDAGRVFVGQRKEPFAVNLGEVFDLVNTNPVGPVDGEVNIIDDKNITTLALEVPLSCLADNDDVIGGWTSASLRQVRVLNRHPHFKRNKKAAFEIGPWTQVSRLGSPLINEVVIGLKDKDRFNTSEPKNDADEKIGFGQYVTNPTLPAILEDLFGVKAPTLFPRNDLIQAFLTGVPGLNQPQNVTPAEMLRLNITTKPVDASAQDPLAVLAGDIAGFPNGRRPGDDVVDIELRVAMGVLLDTTLAPDGQLPYTDGALVNAGMFNVTFPYFKTPIPGSPSDAGVN